MLEPTCDKIQGKEVQGPPHDHPPFEGLQVSCTEVCTKGYDTQDAPGLAQV